MKLNTIRQLTPGLLLTSLLALTVCRLGAVDLNLSTNLPPLTFHGFVSQGFLASTKYNYLGDSMNGSFRFTEAGLNASMNPFPRTHITAQGFLFDVGDVGRYEPVLDYASIEYTFNDYLGLRGGRIRRPQGIYNTVVDVDLARTSILLPQGLYDARFRDFYASLDGGEFFGSLPLRKAGSLSYEAYFGYAHPSTKGGVGHAIHNHLPPGSSVDELSSPLTVGEQIWWNTPLDGLRAGVAWQHAFNFKQDLTLNLPPPPFGPGPVKVHSDADVDVAQLSLDYAWKRWTFQAEYQRLWLSANSGSAGFVSDSWYAGAVYRFNKWFEAGTYYTESYGNVRDRDGAMLPVPSDAYQKDLALSLRFDPASWWVLKVEGHYIHGTGLLNDNAANPTRNNDGWFMLALKSTFSF